MLKSEKMAIIAQMLLVAANLILPASYIYRLSNTP